jgi:hypothetical protein
MLRSSFGGSHSVNGFFRKIARFAVSKMAAFCYAVAVGVAGNLAFHFVQPQVSIPSFLTAAPEPSRTSHEQAGTPTATAIVAPKPAAAPVPEPAALAPAAPAHSAAAAVRPAPPNPSPALQLPDPPAANLPQPVSLPSPAWKPLHLPSAAAPSEVTAKPIGAPNAEASNPAPAASLPPLGPAIEVAVPPSPPPIAPAPPIAGVAPSLPHATEPPPERSLELSDLWHPYRAVKKGLDWAGDQLPVVGGEGPEPSPAASPRREAPAAIPAAASAHAAPVAKPAVSAEPIPLWPDTKPEAPDKPPPGKPGPGSGGLY